MKDGMQTMTTDLTILWMTKHSVGGGEDPICQVETIKLKTKRTIHKHCTLGDKFFFLQEYGLNSKTTLHI